MSARSDKKPLASPGNFFPRRKRRVTKLFTEFLRRSFLPLPHFAPVYHHIMHVALSLDLDLTKFHQSCSHDLNLLLARASGQRGWNFAFGGSSNALRSWPVIPTVVFR